MPRKAGAKKRQATAAASIVEVKKKKKEVAKSSTSKEEIVEKVVQFTGSIPVDEEFPKYAKGPYHVYKEGDTVYNVMLNQTNIGENNNKYYIIQVVQHNTKNEFVNLCRWGRVGKIAGKSVDMNHPTAAKTEFATKFYSKTGNRWNSPVGYHDRPGKYKLVHIDYGEEESKEKVKTSDKIIPSKLPKEVQDMIQLIFDKKEWEATVKEMKFDIKKAPLGKLTKKQITAGYESLKKIEECLKPGVPESDLVDACSEFYTRVPHDFGMKRPPLIRTPEEIKEKVELLEALNDIQIAVNLMDKEEKGKKTVNQLDAYYDSLACDIKPLKKKDPNFKLVETYVKNSHEELHSDLKLNIDNVFEVHREQSNKKFKKNIGKRMLLWHGSRLTNWCGILKEGLRIAPPEAPASGYMFGKGVYFADMVSKSAGYCATSSCQPVGFLLICDVALGNMNEITNSDFNASKLPKGKHSTKALGGIAPPPNKNHALPSGAEIPLGKPVATNNKKSWLLHNEYIVYDTAQINPRFLVQLRFNYG